MNEVESFDMEDHESLNHSHHNFTSHMNNSLFPRRLNDSRMSDITVDLKNLKVKSSLLENKISEKAKEIAELESKVEEIDALSKLNEDKDKRPSTILSKIEEHMFALRVMQMDISAIHAQSLQDDTFAPTLTKLNEKLKADTSKVIQMEDHSSTPSTGQEETPVSKRINERNQILIDSLVKENNNLRGLMNNWAAQNKSPNANDKDSVETKHTNINPTQGPGYLAKKQYIYLEFLDNK